MKKERNVMIIRLTLFQMAQNGTYLVGCGYAVCDGSQFTRYYVCDYAAG